MSVEFLEITDPRYISDCARIQKRLFNLTDIDVFPTAFFNLLIRKEHPLGYIVGCFRKKTDSDKKKLIGLSVAQSDISRNAFYSLFLGVLPEYQHSRYGYSLSLKTREIALKKNKSVIYGLYDPLEANIGKLHTLMGSTANKYIVQPYKINNNQVSFDKVLFKWNLKSKRVKNRIEKKNNPFQFKKLISRYPIVNKTESSEKKILIEVPLRYHDLVQNNSEQAVFWRKKTRELFIKYINGKKYRIEGCVSGRIDKEKKTFYILKK